MVQKLRINGSRIFFDPTLMSTRGSKNHFLIEILKKLHYCSKKYTLKNKIR